MFNLFHKHLYRSYIVNNRAERIQVFPHYIVTHPKYWRNEEEQELEFSDKSSDGINYCAVGISGWKEKADGPRLYQWNKLPIIINL